MDWLKTLVDWLKGAWWAVGETIRWDVPKVVLTILLLGFIWSIWKLQQRPNFDFADIYKDETGKVSSGRFILIGSWIAGTWYVMQTMMDGVPDTEVFAIYMSGTGLTGLGMKALDKLKGKVTVTEE